MNCCLRGLRLASTFQHFSLNVFCFIFQTLTRNVLAVSTICTHSMKGAGVILFSLCFVVRSFHELPCEDCRVEHNLLMEGNLTRCVHTKENIRLLKGPITMAACRVLVLQIICTYLHVLKYFNRVIHESYQVDFSCKSWIQKQRKQK